jgi:hypothetical protein
MEGMTSLTPSEAIVTAIQVSGKTKEQVSALTFFLFGKHRFSELTVPQQWTLVCCVEPSSDGPYGFSMKPFDD